MCFQLLTTSKNVNIPIKFTKDSVTKNKTNKILDNCLYKRLGKILGPWKSFLQFVDWIFGIFCICNNMGYPS